MFFTIIWDSFFFLVYCLNNLVVLNVYSIQISSSNGTMLFYIATCISKWLIFLHHFNVTMSSCARTSGKCLYEFILNYINWIHELKEGAILLKFWKIIAGNFIISYYWHNTDGIIEAWMMITPFQDRNDSKCSSIYFWNLEVTTHVHTSHC